MSQSAIRPRRPAALALVAILGAVGLSACVTQPPAMDAGIGFREARFAEVTAMRDYRKCRDDALTLDRQGRETGDAAKYLASAKLLETCESDLGPEAAGIARDERLQAYALSIQNFLKGGDLTSARSNLQRLSQAHPGVDLYYPDGSSFVDTMEVLLGLRPDHAVARFSDANVNRDLKGEMRRVQYWQSH
ncbi:hypothetical protein [Magnetospira sp. QH-2]|uniref:hypothetical protein n=1 Tax=Magnetospira sp. (strain QH-2) TaxID=1288970 RepID=UPI0003E81B8A|nr:hypothetical protein [Magnetospira sp. QH-2]CCQ75281.1 conserved exported protein of unknown function [Magnetospira sp. QH-2]